MPPRRLKYTPALDAARQAREVLAQVEPGATIQLALPDGCFSRMEAAKRIASEARRMWGNGSFSSDSRSRHGYVIITRKDAQNGTAANSDR